MLSSDGNEVGKVEHVLAALEENIFDGIVIDTTQGPGGHRFADADLVDSIHEGGVLTVDAAAAERLAEPSENPAVVDTDPTWGTTEDRLQAAPRLGPAFRALLGRSVSPLGEGQRGRSWRCFQGVQRRPRLLTTSPECFSRSDHGGGREGNQEG